MTINQAVKFLFATYPKDVMELLTKHADNKEIAWIITNFVHLTMSLSSIMWDLQKYISDDTIHKILTDAELHSNTERLGSHIIETAFKEEKNNGQL